MASPHAPNIPPSHSVHAGRNVTAVLGPTNTGKTHLAIERMLGHETGVIGLPLRLLAREVYDKIVKRVGADQVALITGEEKIKPEEPRYYVCTVEAMPRDLELDFAAIDEVQLAADVDRGHVFTDRLMHMRGTHETLLLGADTMQDVISKVLPSANFVSRPRLSKLTYSGEKKVSRLPRRSAIVAFSANNVYEVAELIRRQRGGAAVVLGALSPRTRNAQVALYQSGDVDFVVATDAIGMGLNLDIDHVAFAGTRKFDGHTHRQLHASEIGQIAGRAGRHLNDGTFGVTADVAPFESELVMQLEEHQFEPVKMLQWRNRDLDFSSVQSLKESLIQPPTLAHLARARVADDLMALENLTRFAEVKDRVATSDDVHRLWDVCQIPDYRKTGVNQHAEILSSIYQFLADDALIPDDWFLSQVNIANRTDGDIDTLANRIAHVRTWNFIANREDWLKDSAHWQNHTRELEDKLSDALHERLLHRFVDQRTSVLMKRLRDEDELEATIEPDGEIKVEDHLVGRLEGFKFTPETLSDGIDGKAARHAAAMVLDKEYVMRVRRFVAAKQDAFAITPDGAVTWKDEVVARLERSDNRLRPNVVLLTDDHLSAPDRERVQARLDTFLDALIAERLKPLLDLSNSDAFSGLARGVAFQLCEAFGVLRREQVADDIRALDQTARGQLRKCGVRFGAFNIYVPLLLKPKPVELLQVLWSLAPPEGADVPADGFARAPKAGLTSVAADPTLPDTFYQVCGFHVCGPRAVRIDMLERLADMIRPLVAWRKPKVKSAETGAAQPAREAETDAEAAGTSNEASAEASPEVGAGEQPASEAVQAVTETEKEVVKGAEAAAQPEIAATDAAAATAQSAEGAGKGAAATEGPAGATGDGGFRAQPDMMSILGCSAEELAAVLKSLGFRMQRIPVQQEPSSAAEVTRTEPSAAQGNGEQATADAAAVEGAASEEAADDGAFDIIWRPKRKTPPHRDRRGDARQRGRRDGAGQKQGQKAGEHRGRDTKKAGGKHKGPPRGRKRDSRRDGGRRDGGEARSWSSGGKRAGKQSADANNPFAALSALKSQLTGDGDADGDGKKS